MFGWIARAVTARPWLVIIGWLVAGAAIIGLAPSLAEITTTDQAAFLPRDAESVRAADLAKRAFPETDGASGAIVVRRIDSSTLTDTDVEALGGLVDRLDATRPPMVRGYQFDPTRSVSANRRVSLIGVQFTGPSENPAVQAAVDAVRADVEVALSGTGLSAGLTGTAPIAGDSSAALRDAERIVTLATLVLVVALLLLIFRSPVAALLPLVTVGVVLAVSTSLVAIVGTALDVRVGQELPTMLTVVLFGIGTDYLLFLLFRFRERLRAGDEPGKAIVAAVERVGEAIFSAAFAVIAAFGALVLASLGFFTTLGPALALGVVVMLLAALTFVPAVVAILGRGVFWPSTSDKRRTRRPVFAALGRLVAGRPGAVLVAATGLLGGLAAGLLAFSTAYDPVSQLPPGAESTGAYEDLKRGFPAGALHPTQVYVSTDRPSTMADLAALSTQLTTVDGVAAALPPRLAADGRTAAVPLILDTEPFSTEAMDLVAGPLRHEARTAAPAGATVVIGGQTMAQADIRAATDRDLRVILPVAAGLFALILAGLLRALLAPIYLVTMVIAAFLATLGAAAVMFQDTGLAFTIPIIVYLFVTAVGTDYNILITARLREEIRDGRDPRQAAGLAVERAGPSVAAAAVILAGTFGALLISGVPLFVEIGFAVTTGILLSGFVVSLLLVPAATALLGRAAWWPGTAAKTDPGHATGTQNMPADPVSTAMSRPDGFSSPEEARRRP